MHIEDGVTSVVSFVETIVAINMTKDGFIVAVTI